MTEALSDAFSQIRARVREQVIARMAQDESDRSDTRDPMDKRFRALTWDERSSVQEAVNTLAVRLRGALRKRQRRRGTLDLVRTLRRNLCHGGTPLRLFYRKWHHERPRLVLLCDVSDSVRPAAAFFLAIARALGSLVPHTRSFVFVSEIVEITQLFRGATPASLSELLLRDGVVDHSRESNYGNALRGFYQHFGRDLGARTAVVILGDGRNNFLPDDGADQVIALRRRVKSVIWVCPESPSLWGTGDSRMLAFAQAATQVFVAQSPRQLERAARAIVVRLMGTAGTP